MLKRTLLIAVLFIFIVSFCFGDVCTVTLTPKYERMKIVGYVMAIDYGNDNVEEITLDKREKGGYITDAIKIMEDKGWTLEHFVYVTSGSYSYPVFIFRK